MRRIIVDYKKLTPEILSLLVTKYPDGYDDDHIITFRNAKNELIEAVEVRTDDTIYLVKVSARLETSMANFDLDDMNDDDFGGEAISELPDKEGLETDLEDDDVTDEDESPKKHSSSEDGESDVEDDDDDDEDDEDDSDYDEDDEDDEDEE